MALAGAEALEVMEDGFAFDGGEVDGMKAAVAVAFNGEEFGAVAEGDVELAERGERLAADFERQVVGGGEVDDVFDLDADADGAGAVDDDGGEDAAGVGPD